MLSKHGNLDHITLHKTLGGRLLHPWYTIEIKKCGDNKSVTFVSHIHVNKRVDPSFCWSSKFSDSQILSDGHLLGWVAQCYGKVTV